MLASDRPNGGRKVIGTGISALLSRVGWQGTPDQEQGLLRIAIPLTFLCYLAFNWPDTEAGQRLWHTGVIFICSFLIFSSLFFISTLIWTAPWVARRVASILADIMALSYGLYLTGPTGAPWYGVYLWVTLGNGFRYGEKYLYISGATSLVGFGVVASTSLYWDSHRALALGLAATLLVIPAYSAFLIRRLNEAKQRADKASRAKSEFLSRMSHEIRTPLNGILGMTELLRTRSLAPEEREYVETIYASGKTLAHQIDDILDLSKIESGELSVERIEFDLFALINTTLRIFESQAAEKHISLQETINPNTPFLLFGDPHKLRQIIINLVGNAMKFTNKGFVSLRVYPREEQDGNVILRFEVADTGAGIAEHSQDSIFRPFAQANSSVSRQYGGTGLGTTICQHLVSLMDGEIGLQSKPGVGTTFWFDLPFRVVDLPELDESNAWTRDCRVVCLQHENARQTDLLESLNGWKIPFTVARNIRACLQQIDEMQASEGGIGALLIDGFPYGPELDALLDKYSGNDTSDFLPVVVVGGERYPPDIALRVQDHFFVLGRPLDRRALFNVLHACYSRHSTEDDVIHIASRHRAHEDIGLRLNVLIGDDNATNRVVLQRMLEQLGHRCVAVDGGEAVLLALEEADYDIVIVDKNMPDMGGLDVYAAFRMAHGAVSHTPFVILTADATQESRDECVAAGIQYFLTKPVSLSRLQTMLVEAVQDECDVKVNSKLVEKDGEPPEELPVIDFVEFRKLEQLSGGDDQFMRDILINFEGDANRDLRALESATAERDWIAFRDSAHALKGAAMYLGLQELAALSAHAQDISQQDFNDNGIARLRVLRQAADIALAALRDRVNSPRKTG